MPASPETKSIKLTTSWKQHFAGYVLSILTIPLFGIGLIALYFVRKKHLSRQYQVTDTQISSIDSKYQRNIDLVNIEKVTIEQSWLQNKLGIGNLVLHTSATEMELKGMDNPQKLKEMIDTAVAAQKEQSKPTSYREREDPPYKPGEMEKVDYLTGLWQQGLLSDDDFEDEKKHFE